MQITKTYSFKGGQEFIEKNHPEELKDVLSIISDLNATTCLTKASNEKTKVGQLLYSPVDLNKAMKTKFCEKGWTEKSNGKKGYKEPRHAFGKNRFREMDGIKNGVGLEIQFGKYAFMGYDIFSKMVIFNKLGHIECGIEIVPDHNLCKSMSTGVSDFDQLLIDFEYRGESDIDIPVFIIAIGLTDEEKKEGGRLQSSFITDKSDALRVFPVNQSTGALPGPKKIVPNL